MANHSHKPKGVPCPPDVQSAVKALLDASPETVVIARLGLSRNAVTRLAAGLTVRNGTIAQARAALSGTPVADPRQLSLL